MFKQTSNVYDVVSLFIAIMSYLRFKHLFSWSQLSYVFNEFDEIRQQAYIIVALSIMDISIRCSCVKILRVQIFEKEKNYLKRMPVTVRFLSVDYCIVWHIIKPYFF
jgi:hypothetical protein